MFINNFRFENKGFSQEKKKSTFAVCQPCTQKEGREEEANERTFFDETENRKENKLQQILEIHKSDYFKDRASLLGGNGKTKSNRQRRE